MPQLPRLARIARLASLPETRRLLVRAARSEALRDVARRAVHDRAGLVRDVRNPANARAFAREAARHPATEEIANAGLLLMPARYMPLGWAATWAARRLLRRYVDRPASRSVPDAAQSPLPGMTSKAR